MKKTIWSILIGVSMMLWGIQPAAANWLQGLQSINQGTSNASSTINTIKTIGSFMPKGKTKTQTDNDIEEIADADTTNNKPAPKSKKQKRSEERRVGKECRL